MTAEFLNMFLPLMITIAMAFLAGFNSGRVIERKIIKQAMQEQVEEINRIASQLEQAAKR